MHNALRYTDVIYKTLFLKARNQSPSLLKTFLVIFTVLVFFAPSLSLTVPGLSGIDSLLSGLLKTVVNFGFLTSIFRLAFASISLYCTVFENFTDFVFGSVSFSLTLTGVSSALIVQAIFLTLFFAVVIVIFFIGAAALSIPSYLRASLCIGMAWSACLDPRRANIGLTSVSVLTVGTLTVAVCLESELPSLANTVCLDGAVKRQSVINYTNSIYREWEYKALVALLLAYRIASKAEGPRFEPAQAPKVQGVVPNMHWASVGTTAHAHSLGSGACGQNVEIIIGNWDVPNVHRLDDMLTRGERRLLF